MNRTIELIRPNATIELKKSGLFVLNNGHIITRFIREELPANAKPSHRNPKWFWSWRKEEQVCKEIPLELLEEIGKRLSSRLDILRFRSVCKNWRLSLPSPTRFPLRVPSLPGGDVETSKLPHFITEVNTYHQDACWWAGDIVLEEVDQDGKFYAHRRYNRDGYSPHIRLEAKIGFPAMSFTRWWRRTHTPYDRLNFVSKAHHLRIALPRCDDPTQLDYHYNKSADRMIIVSSCTDDINPSYAKQSDLSVIAVVSAGTMQGRLALLRLKGPCESWAWDIDQRSARLFHDVTIYKGQVCVLDVQGCAVIVDFDDSGLVEMTQLSGPFPYFDYGIGGPYLYEYFGGLCLAIDTGELWVIYKLHFRSKRWFRAYTSSTIAAIAARLTRVGRVLTALT